MNKTQLMLDIIKERQNDEEYYINVLESLDFDFKLFYDNIEIFNIRHLVNHCKLNEEIVNHLISEELEDFDFIIEKQQISDMLIDNILSKDPKYYTVDRMYNIQIMQRISCKLIQKHTDILDMQLISENQFLDCRYLIDNRDKINWAEIMLNQKMHPVINEGFIALFYKTNLWDNIAFSGICIETIVKYKEHFTEKSYKGFMEVHELNHEEIEKLAIDHHHVLLQVEELKD